jgi:hypothetical protein
MFTSKVFKGLLVLTILALCTNASYAHKPGHKFSNQGYQNAGYYNNYDPNYYAMDNYDNYKIKKALKYGAVGAGASYLLSRDGSKCKNALVGGGVGAAIGYFLDR